MLASEGGILSGGNATDLPPDEVNSVPVKSFEDVFGVSGDLSHPVAKSAEAITASTTGLWIFMTASLGNMNLGFLPGWKRMAEFSACCTDRRGLLVVRPTPVSLVLQGKGRQQGFYFMSKVNIPIALYYGR